MLFRAAAWSWSIALGTVLTLGQPALGADESADSGGQPALIGPLLASPLATSDIPAAAAPLAETIESPKAARGNVAGFVEVTDSGKPSPLAALGRQSARPLPGAGASRPAPRGISGGTPALAEPAPVAARETSAPAVTDRGPSEQVVERRADGSVAVEREVVRDSTDNYVNHGRYTLYAPDGRVLREGNYVAGELDGAWMQVLPQNAVGAFAGELTRSFAGPFTSHAQFKAGQLDGVWMVVAQDQAKVVQWQFQGGQRHGQWTWWYPSGELRRAVSYEHGKAVGELLEWDTRGNATIKAVFVDGQPLVQDVGWHRPGVKAFEGGYLLVGKSAEPVFDWWNCVVQIPASESRQRQKHGHWTSWYPNGQKQVEGDYAHDLPTGQFTWWHENGQQQAVGQFADGLQQGVWTAWHANGQREYQAEYTSGLMQGQFRRWHDDGRLAESYDFDKEGSDLSRPNLLPKSDVTASPAAGRKASRLP